MRKHLGIGWVTNYTCLNYERASVDDYLIVKETIYEKILNFRVLPLTFDSKHSPIVATLKCHTKTPN